MKLILIALIPLVLISICSMAGMGTTFTLGSAHYGADPSKTIYYDYGGNPTAYANETAYRAGDSGTWEDAAGDLGWHNESVTYYYLYWDSSGSVKIKFEDRGQSFDSGLGISNISISGAVGFFALITMLIVIGVVAGARFLTYGQAEETVSLILKGTAFGAVWAVFSTFSYNVMLGSNQIILQVAYITLTLIFTLGVVNSFGHPSGDF